MPMSLLAAGHAVDLVIEAGLQSGDVAGPHRGGAGGRRRGDELAGTGDDGGTIIAAGSPELHAEALALLNGD